MFTITLRDPLGVTYQVRSQSAKQDQSSPYQIRSNGPEGSALSFRNQMVGSYGAFGHRIGNSTSPEDIHAYAMGLKQQGWKVKVTEGNIGTYVAPPEGAVF
jgi:hypothetical protein